jgi:hypothetical protein
MIDTPRTESFNCYDSGCDDPLHAWGAFAAELERELNAANDRIKRLEEAGDELGNNHNPFTYIDWLKAKEAKP